MRRFVCAMSLLAVSVMAAPARALPINAIDSGWYRSTGQHVAGNDNYVAGNLGSDELRNFFVFDLKEITDEIVAATLELYNPDNALPALRGYVSPDPTETYQLFDVTTPIATLSASNAGAAGISVFDDLGTGAQYGQVTVSSADNGQVVSIALNQSGLAALNAAREGQFALGGAIGTLGSPGDEYVFGFSVLLDNPDVRRLDITTASVPEPTTLLLVGGGLVVAAMRGRSARRGRR